MAPTAGAALVQSWEPRPSRSHMWLQDPQELGPPSSVFPVHKPRAELEAEQLEHEPVPIWDDGTIGWSISLLHHCSVPRSPDSYSANDGDKICVSPIADIILFSQSLTYSNYSLISTQWPNKTQINKNISSVRNFSSYNIILNFRSTWTFGLIIIHVLRLTHVNSQDLSN